MLRESDVSSSGSEADPRRSLESPLIVRRVRPDDGRCTFFGYASNISRSGLFVNATEPKKPGERFEVEIPLPRPLDQTVRCICEVVWARKRTDDFHLVPGMGIRFVDLPREEAERIGEWIEEGRRRARWGR